MIDHRNARRVSRELDECLPRDWDKNVVDHPLMQRWLDELRFRFWRHKALLYRIGSVGPDWLEFVAEVEGFTYINEAMLHEIEQRKSPPKEEAA